ncbi:MAG: hypothetical protein ACI85V_001114 [bacterium]|jgi:hypothetical protein
MTYFMYSDLLLLAPALLVFLVLLGLRWRQTETVEHAEIVEEGPPANAIVVDGSNVMYWGGDPSMNVLARVLRDVERKGYVPIVFFDASVGYKISERYHDEKALASLIGIRFDHICVVSKGVIADESILMFARDHRLRVITNDHFRDWRTQFPHSARKKNLVSGRWTEGNLKWDRPLKAQH